MSIVKRLLLGVFALTISLTYPSAASFAEDTPSSNTAAGQSQTAPSDQPSGTDAATYHYNTSTGKWENEHYIWDPVTRKTTPKDNLPYSYNPATGKWDTTEWRYNGATSKWEPNTVSVSQPPAGSQTVDSPTTTAETNSTSSTSPTIANAADTNPAAVATPTNNTALTPGANSNTSSSASSYFDGFYNAAISNTVTSNALSGDALVTGNLTGGNATSGNATATTNVFNLLQSTAAFEKLSDVNTFVTNIDGDVYGDVLISPDQLGNLQPASYNNGLINNTQVNVAQGNSITNNLSLDARSGSASVTDNNTAGDATTGNANTVANLVNLINSSIAANQSFIGTLNINGNLNGDILLPPDVLQTLLASNAPTATISLSSADRSNLDASLASDQSVSNNIHASATTGNATVASNNSGGNASTGDSKTTITVLNLTGRQVVGDNSLLVFVNVLGKWVGAIINAPQGATAAALGGGIGQNDISTNSDNNISTSQTNKITNNVTANAASGDANVRHNLHGGNATSGDATASATVTNVENTHMSLSGWFGILFVNVFGSWFGSFGMDTEAGGITSHNTSNNDAPKTTNPGKTTQGVHVFRFITTTASSQTATSGAITSEVDPAVSQTPTTPTAHVLGADTAAPSPQLSHKERQTSFNFPLGALSIGGGLFAAERALARPRHSRH